MPFGGKSPLAHEPDSKWWVTLLLMLVAGIVCCVGVSMMAEATLVDQAVACAAFVGLFGGGMVLMVVGGLALLILGLG